MHFNINPGDGGNSRVADAIHFVDGEGAKHTLTGGFQAITLVNAGDERTLTDVDEAAGHLARLLYTYRDLSLVIPVTSGRTMRGDEGTSADVFPPGRHPRVTILAG